MDTTKETDENRMPWGIKAVLLAAICAASGTIGWEVGHDHDEDSASAYVKFVPESHLYSRAGILTYSAELHSKVAIYYKHALHFYEERPSSWASYTPTQPLAPGLYVFKIVNLAEESNVRTNKQCIEATVKEGRNNFIHYNNSYWNGCEWRE